MCSSDLKVLFIKLGPHFKVNQPYNSNDIEDIKFIHKRCAEKGIYTVATKIEQNGFEKKLMAFKDLNIDYAQGFGFGKNKKLSDKEYLINKKEYTVKKLDLLFKHYKSPLVLPQS